MVKSSTTVRPVWATMKTRCRRWRVPPSATLNEAGVGAWKTITRRSESGYGRGESSNVCTTLKIAVLAPMPSASVRIATAAKPGALSSWRRAKRRS